MRFRVFTNTSKFIASSSCSYKLHISKLHILLVLSTTGDLLLLISLKLFNRRNAFRLISNSTYKDFYYTFYSKEL